MLAILWGLGLFLVLLALLLLLCLYITGHFRTAEEYHLTGIGASAPHFLSTVASLSDSILTEGEVVRFLSDIETIQTARLSLAAKARTLIQFETFIMTSGRRADEFAAILKQKAEEGVTVQILADSYGAGSLPDTYWRQLTNAGAEVRFFNPFSGRAPLDFIRRNHRKLLIVDQHMAMVGGAGISDLWDGKDQHDGQVDWYDFEVEWRGAMVGLLTGFFWQHWLSAGGHVDLSTHDPERSHLEGACQTLITPGEDPSTGNSPIRGLFQLMILAAEKRLWMASPYLLPDQATCKMLAIARQKGVDVRILTMGPRSDKPYVYYVSRERYGALLEADIKIHEYQPSMMHAKIVLIDDCWVSLGSANLDPRSFFHNDELNLCTPDRKLIQQVEHFFQDGFAQSHLVQSPLWKKRPIKEKLVGRLVNCIYWQL